MNRTKLARRTALAARLHDRHNPPFRVLTTWIDGSRVTVGTATTRAGARTIKASNPGTWVEQRQPNGSYTKVR